MNGSSILNPTGLGPRRCFQDVDRNDTAEGGVSAGSNDGSSQPPLDAFPELEWNWQFAPERSWCVFSAPPFLWRFRYR